jgi:hypothetical protein
MDWTAVFETLMESGLIGWIVGLIGLTFVSALWNMIREGYKVNKKRIEATEDGVWTEQERIDYIDQSIKYWNAMSNFWKIVWNAVKKIFTKKK